MAADGMPESTRLAADCERLWDESALLALTEYLRIPNKSPMFDPDWAENGHMDRAAALLEAWCREQALEDMRIETLRLPGRTPLLFVEATGRDDVPATLIYGHMDKQPEMAGWRDGLGPWQPVLEDGRLYGRGGADDGYAVFAALIALRALAEQEVSHGRCMVLIEASEESGSGDLPAYLDTLSDRIGTPGLIVCLDSGCGDYERLWCTTSLRGLVGGELHVEILREGVHSGDAGGIVPTPLQVLRALLGRLEDERTGRVRVAEFTAPISPEREEQAREAAAVLGARVHARFPFVDGAGPLAEDPTELILNRTWRAALAVTGAQGLPSLVDAGNVLLPCASFKLALRLPPTCPADRAAKRLRRLLEADPPFGARVRYEPGWQASGWETPPLPVGLNRAAEHASQRHFDRPAAYMGEGGSIPFVPMLDERFPRAAFLVTGVLGPGANAHGPNEFLHLETARRLTACLAEVLAGMAHAGKVHK